MHRVYRLDARSHVHACMHCFPAPMYTHITHRVCIHRVYRHDAHSHMHAHMHCLPTCMCTQSTHVAYIHHAQRPRTQNHTHMHYLPTPMHTYGHTYMRMHITIIRRDASHNLMCVRTCMHVPGYTSKCWHTYVHASYRRIGSAANIYLTCTHVYIFTCFYAHTNTHTHTHISREETLFTRTCSASPHPLCIPNRA
jgi:hypothetical protein